MQGLLQRDMLNSSNDYIRSPLSLIVKSCRHCVLMILMKLCMVDILNYALESEGTWICWILTDISVKKEITMHWNIPRWKCEKSLCHSANMYIPNKIFLKRICLFIYISERQLDSTCLFPLQMATTASGGPEPKPGTPTRSLPCRCVSIWAIFQENYFGRATCILYPSVQLLEYTWWPSSCKST